MGAVLVAAACTNAAQEPAGQEQGTLAWTDCGDGFQCSTLEVPRDWAAPDGAKISLALVKLPAPGERKGTVFVNWGGPGASGTSSIRGDGKAIADATGGTLDVVTWDPRGLGQSTPITCPEGNTRYFEADPGTPDGLRAMAAAAQERLAACQARYGDYLGLLGTSQGVQDLEAIRVATGEPVLNFLGHSYGTRVGATYAAMYPGTVGNMVLDGSMSQLGTIRDTAYGMVEAGEAALDVWFDRCAAKPDCAFGPDPAAGFDTLVAKVRAEQPLVPGTDGARLTGGLLYQALLAGVVDYRGSQELAEQAVGQYLRDDDPSALHAVGLAIAGQRPDGTFTNGPEIFQFVNCSDWTDRPDLTQVAADVAVAGAYAPRFGPFALTYALTNFAACPQQSAGLPVPNGPVAGKVLVLANTYDAETPLKNGQELMSLIPGSRLLVFQGLGHTAFYRSACMATAAGRLLTSGEQPAPGAVCAA
ncbi:alpha/beta fold hydrolase [Pseudonocardia pini]|uniref:alpha/beta fold hydrolase n=1 Tax=Pseudonocardia pini TaxID=2758030 RepID=UPI0015F0B85D|nr:alpha/beta fold hydrolase [Pseudonocardia pini]